MAEENVPTPAPTISDEQILPFNAWLPVGQSNYLLDLQKLQKNPIFHISVDILQNTNFFRAFIASANWFTLNVDLLCKALEFTPEDSAHPFVSPPADEQVIDFMNELGDVSLCRTDIQEKNKKKAKNKQFQARSRKGQSQKSDKARKYNLGGQNCQNLKLYCKRERQGLKLQRR
ncbi:hypothetical protein Tco_1374147 [Tanacetum coccineum]